MKFSDPVESVAFRRYCDAGFHYLRLLHAVRPETGDLRKARADYLAMRGEWHEQTASIEGRLTAFQILARAA